MSLCGRNHRKVGSFSLMKSEEVKDACIKRLAAIEQRRKEEDDSFLTCMANRYNAHKKWMRWLTRWFIEYTPITPQQVKVGIENSKRKDLPFFVQMEYPSSIFTEDKEIARRLLAMAEKNDRIYVSSEDFESVWK